MILLTFLFPWVRNLGRASHRSSGSVSQVVAIKLWLGLEEQSAKATGCWLGISPSSLRVSPCRPLSMATLDSSRLQRCPKRSKKKMYLLRPSLKSHIHRATLAVLVRQPRIKRRKCKPHISTRRMSKTNDTEHVKWQGTVITSGNYNPLKWARKRTLRGGMSQLFRAPPLRCWWFKLCGISPRGF